LTEKLFGSTTAVWPKPKNTVRSILSGTKPARTTSKKPENTHKKPANPVRNLVKKAKEGTDACTGVGTGRRLPWPRSVTRLRAS